MQSSRLPLSGYRVLDLSRVLAGPYCSMLLGDLGADVIKVERPGMGDDTRKWGPPFVGDDSVYFQAFNRNKRSLALDFSKPEGSQILRRLAGCCDILIENFLPGTLAKYRLDFNTLNKINKDLIYCSITGYGQTGPWSHRAGYDVVVSGVGGLMHITGSADVPPCRVGVAVTDLSTGLHAQANILAALVPPNPRESSSESSRRGCHIDCNLLSTQIAMLSHIAASYLTSDVDAHRIGTSHPNVVPYQAFPTRDAKWILLGAGNDIQFGRLCNLVGCSKMATDDRFKTNADRVKNRVELNEIISNAIQNHTLDYWVRVLEDSKLPYGPVNSLKDVFQNPQVRHLSDQLIYSWQCPEGTLKVPGYPVYSSAFQTVDSCPPPKLGQHSRSLLWELLEMPDFELDELEDKGVIQDGN